MRYGEFICTDNSCEQYVAQLNEDLFICIQYDLVKDLGDKDYMYVVRLQIINILDYKEDDIESYVEGYYESLSALREQYPAEAVNGIIAECIFEESFGYDVADEIVKCTSVKEAEAEIQRMIRRYTSSIFVSDNVDSQGVYTCCLLPKVIRDRIAQNLKEEAAISDLEQYASREDRYTILRDYNKLQSFVAMPEREKATSNVSKAIVEQYINNKM